MTLQEEAILISKVKAGNMHAYTHLVNAYKHYAITLAYNILLNHHDAEDAAQDAFIKAYTSLSAFRQQSRYCTWLYRIVINVSLNKLKRNKLQPTTSTEDVASTINDDIADNTIIADQRKYLKAAMLNLKEQERICITLYYLNELSVEEINTITGYSLSNIKVILYRGRKQLALELKKLLQMETFTLI